MVDWLVGVIIASIYPLQDSLSDWLLFQINTGKAASRSG
jgi:hypothetical protein